MIDVLTDDTALRLDLGTECFVPLESEETEHPVPGEIIFAEGKTVLSRRWIWHQASHTLFLPESRSIESDVDGLPPRNQDQIEQICEEPAALILESCGGKTRYEIPSKSSG